MSAQLLPEQPGDELSGGSAKLPLQRSKAPSDATARPAKPLTTGPRQLDPTHERMSEERHVLLNMLYCFFWAITGRVKAFTVIVYADDESNTDSVFSHGGEKKMTLEQ